MLHNVTSIRMGKYLGWLSVWAWFAFASYLSPSTSGQQLIPEISPTQAIPLRPPAQPTPQRVATMSAETEHAPTSIPARVASRWKPSADLDVTLVTKALSLVLGLFFGFIWLLRIRGKGADQTPVFEHLGSHALVNRHRVHVVRVGRRLLLLTQQGKQLKPISEITDPDEVDEITEACRNRRQGTTRASQIPEELAMVNQAVREISRS